jgi:hypothetical protein
LKKVGDTVNIETDMIGKYVERFVLDRGPMEGKPGIPMAVSIWHCWPNPDLSDMDPLDKLDP